MPTGRHSRRRGGDDQGGLTRRRFLRAAGVGSAGAMVAAGAVIGQAGAEVAGAGAAVPAGSAARRPPRRRVIGAAGQQAVAALAASGPLSFHTISPQRYLDTRADSGEPFPPQGGTGDVLIFDFGHPDYFQGGIPNEVPPGARALACNLTVTGGRSGGNLRAFPANSDVIPLFSNLNWLTFQTVGNYAIVAAATPADGEFWASVAMHNAATQRVHLIVDISGYFI